MAACEQSPPAQVTSFTHTLSTPFTHLPTAPVDPSTMTVYTPSFDHPLHVSPSDSPAIAVSPPANPSTSPHGLGSSESDGDDDYVPPSDDDEDYRPTQSASYQKQKKLKTVSKPKPSHPVPFSPSRSTSESKKSGTPRKTRRSHPYKRNVPSRNFQSKDSALYTNKRADFRCPVVGCGHVQRNQRIPDLKRHILTHGRWREPEKWICCGVGTDRAHLYEGLNIRQGMTDEECIEAGAYLFKGRLSIGGCKQTFSRRDALKRHLDNPDLPCVVDMDSYHL